MKRTAIPSVLLLLCATVLQGCQSDGIIADGWGTSGYARVTGTAHLANGAAIANRPVGFLCGPESPTVFGDQTTTNAAGAFVLNIEAPGPVLLPESGAMVCRFVADTVPGVSLERAIPFSARKSERPTTAIVLQQP